MSIKLTQTVQKGGCAAKVTALELREILKKVQFPPTDHRILVDGSTFDDASAYLVNDDLAMIQTLDFFTPILDDPYDFGRVAAANAMSDVFAMGARPQTSLAILAFPTASFPHDVVAAILQGASDQIRLAKSFFVGGHTIDDDTLKFGLSVTGFCHPQKIWSNQKAKSGDVLILTKAIGTGTLCAALKREAIDEKSAREVVESMAQLNNIMDYLKPEQLDKINAATDITGFGLLGHASHIAKASKKSLRLNYSQIPFFEKAEAFLKEGFLTKAHRTNKDYVGSQVQIKASLSETKEKLLYDPQTSGGLLLSVNPQAAPEILDRLKKAFPATCQIGEVIDSADSLIEVEA